MSKLVGQNPSQQHLSALDFYRFLAACGIVLFHFSLSGTSPWLTNALDHFNLFVDFFFILSGVVITRAYHDRVGSFSQVCTFIRRRIARIYPLHIAMVIVFLSAAFLTDKMNLPFHNGDHASIDQIAAQITLTQSWRLNPELAYNIPSWSISVELFLYLLFPLIMLLYRTTGLSAIVLMLVAGFIALEVLSSNRFITGGIWTENFSPLRGIPTFALGCLIALITQNLRIRLGVLLGAISLGLAIAVMFLHGDVYTVILLFALSILLTVGGEATEPKHFLSGRFCRVLGDASYSIYMLHYFILIVVVRAFWQHFLHRPIPVIGGLIVLTFVCALSIQVFRHFEKPMRDLLSGNKRYPQAAMAAE